MTKPTGIDRLIKACSYTKDGLVDTFKTEDAFRQECLIALIGIPAAFFFAPNRIALVLMIGSLLIVLAMELLNSAIEAAVDRAGMGTHPLAKKAKDAGSAAVFITLVNVALVWGFMLAG